MSQRAGSNKEPLNNTARIFLERPFYCSGEKVSGFACIDCVAAFKCHEVSLKAEGYEKTTWYEKISTNVLDDVTGKWRQERTEVPRQARRQLFRVEVPLHVFGTTCAEGQYKLPFSFVLPYGLPGSVLFTESFNDYGGNRTFHDTKAKVRYKLTLESVTHGVMRPVLRAKRPLPLHELPAEPASSKEAVRSSEAKGWWCTRKGEAVARAAVQKDFYHHGDTATVVLQVENRSTIAFKSVQLFLRRTMLLQSGPDEAKQRCDAEVAKALFPGLPAMANLVGESARLLQVPLKDLKLYPTSCGQLVDCQYDLLVNLHAAKWMKDIKLTVPLVIFDPPERQPPLEPTWRPTVIGKEVVLELPEVPTTFPAPLAVLMEGPSLLTAPLDGTYTARSSLNTSVTAGGRQEAAAAASVRTSPSAPHQQPPEIPHAPVAPAPVVPVPAAAAPAETPHDAHEAPEAAAAAAAAAAAGDAATLPAEALPAEVSGEPPVPAAASGDQPGAA